MMHIANFHVNNLIKELCSKIGLPQETLDLNAVKVNLVEFNAQQVLFKPGDNCQIFLVLVVGSIRVELTSKTGRDVTLYRMTPGESCVLTTSALFNKELYYAQGVAESKVIAIAISDIDFYRAIEISTIFARYVLQGYAARISSIIQLVDRMSTRDVMHDVCNYLLANMNNKNQVVATHDGIAKEIGTAREVVGRKLALLDASGGIKRRRGIIEILDDSRLLANVT